MLTTHPHIISSDKDKKLQIVPVVASELDMYWDLMVPFLQVGLRHAYGMLSINGLKDTILSGYSMPFLFLDDDVAVCLVIVDIMVYAEYKSARIVFLAGSRIADAFEYFDEFVDWAHVHGCIEVEAWCRPSMVRYAQRFGFQPGLMRMTRTLRKGLQ